MPRINQRLPGCLSAGFQFGPEFKTQIVTGPNGAEYRNRDWLYGRWRAIGNYHAFGEEDQAMMDAAFQAAAGMWAAFRVRDTSRPDRWYVDGQALEPDIGTDTSLQVIRSYEWGSFQTERMIQALDDDFVLRKDGVVFTEYTLDKELGLVVPDSAWDAGTYTWTGSHDLWMRFNSDWGASSVVGQRFTSADIELIEVRQFPDPES